MYFIDYFKKNKWLKIAPIIIEVLHSLFFQGVVDIEDVLRQISDVSLGVELDMDAIIDMPSSAFTPSGFSLEEARKYVIKCAKSKKAAYLHLPEAAPKNEREEAIVGKALAYLVSDFIKS